MRLLVSLVVWTLRAVLTSRRSLAMENLALRQQLATYARMQKRPRLKAEERAFWIALSRVWQGWRSPLVFVKPATVIDWHRKPAMSVKLSRRNSCTLRPRLTVVCLIWRIATKRDALGGLAERSHPLAWRHGGWSSAARSGRYRATPPPGAPGSGALSGFSGSWYGSRVASPPSCAPVVS